MLCVKVPLITIALYRCVQIERRWKRCAVSSESTVATVTRRPYSLANINNNNN